ERLNSIKEIKKMPKEGYAVLEAGVLIEDLKNASEKQGLFYTYDPTEQTAFVGGTIATNASGARSFRYGPTRAHIRALKLILADGTIFNLRRGEVIAKGRLFEFEINKKNFRIKAPSYKMPRTKNSSGYYAEDNMDLVDLFIGQEGTLAVIAEAEVRLFKKPGGFFSCFVFFNSEPPAWEFAKNIALLGPISIEYFDRNSLGLLQDKFKNVPDKAVSAIFFEELEEGNESVLIEKWDEVLHKHGISSEDTWVAMNKTMIKEFLDMRHYIPEEMARLAKRSGFLKISTDLAVPNDKSIEMLKYYKKVIGESSLRYFIFGHIGDAHLHVNMLPDNENSYKKAKQIQLELIKKSIALGGTVSAEHGIGKTKKEFLKLLYGEKGVREMIEVKKVLDPNLILGRGNIFDV
ncbi:MAG: FAD-binding oxidoreductase, partial [Candidatus Omnitrophota bacterium]